MAVRINIQRLSLRLIFSLIVPMALTILIDLQGGWFPWLTIVASAIFIPFSTIVVIRTALSEMDRVVQLIAPVKQEPAELINGD